MMMMMMMKKKKKKKKKQQGDSAFLSLNLSKGTLTWFPGPHEQLSHFTFLNMKRKGLFVMLLSASAVSLHGALGLSDRRIRGLCVLYYFSNKTSRPWDHSADSVTVNTPFNFEPTV
jgi:hypothetical protein